MIVCNKGISKFEGTAKELSLEFTHIILGFKSNLIKEFKLSNDEANEVLVQCGKIAFMSSQEAKDFLNYLLSQIEEV